MSDERDPAAGGLEDALPSVGEVARLDRYLERITGERRPEAQPLTAREVADRILAAQLRLAREGVEEPAPAFLGRLEARVASAVARERSGRRPRVSRGGFLRTVAAMAGGAGLGTATIEAVRVAREPERPHELVAAGHGRWYDIAAAGEVREQGVKAFTAGGVVGYLLNDGGRLHAFSGICTHMGCRLKPAAESGDLHCLCHGSRFSRRGAVTGGLAPSALPAIEVRVEHGRVHALGTEETV